MFLVLNVILLNVCTCFKLTRGKGGKKKNKNKPSSSVQFALFYQCYCQTERKPSRVLRRDFRAHRHHPEA